MKRHSLTTFALVVACLCLFITCEASKFSKIKEIFGRLPDALEKIMEKIPPPSPNKAAAGINAKKQYCTYFHKIVFAPRAPPAAKKAAFNLFRKHCLS
ncbi:hypothetical protein OROHE_005833 [Orobanche hederae]